MTADFCDVGFNDSAQTIQTILIFLKIALSVTDWGAKVFWYPSRLSWLFIAVNQTRLWCNGLPQCIVIRNDDYRLEFTEYANVSV